MLAATLLCNQGLGERLLELKKVSPEATLMLMSIEACAEFGRRHAADLFARQTLPPLTELRTRSNRLFRLQ